MKMTIGTLVYSLHFLIASSTIHDNIQPPLLISLLLLVPRCYILQR
jgi:hypothetical protein